MIQFDLIKKIYNKMNNDKDHVVFVDFTKPSSQVRLYIIDIKTNAIIDSMCVANGVSDYVFSNVPGSKLSSIGVYVTAETYQGKHGLSRRIDGQDVGFNNNARSRAIVIHSASYIGGGKTGRSWGCFAVSSNDIDNLLNHTKRGTLLIAYYPSSLWKKYL